MATRVEQFAALVERQPDSELFRFSLAQALEAAGRADEAELHYAFCAAKKADWMMPRILRGKILLRAGRHAEAAEVLHAALRLAVDQHHEAPEAELRALLGDPALPSPSQRPQ